MIAKITFEDKEEDVEIGIENQTNACTKSSGTVICKD